MDNLIVRPAKKSDSETLAKLNFEFNQTLQAPEAIAENLEIGSEIVMVAEVDGKVIGFACAQYFKSFCYGHLSGEITETYVIPVYRRTGVASAMLEALEVALRDLDAQAIKIITGRDNNAAKIAYQKKGYRLKKSVVLIKRTGTEHQDDHH